MTMISYAQNYEDVMLWRALKHVKEGFYIDVGANDPEHDSVTRAFYDVGWHGINIEPVTEWFERLEKERPRDTNLKLAAGETDGELVLYEVIGTGMSTTDEAIAREQAEKHGYELRTSTTPVRTLTSICEEHAPKDVHFLKIDVEGAEGAVLRGLDLTKVRPWIIVVESTLPHSEEESRDEWEGYLTGGGYHNVYFDGLNRFYVADEHGELDSAFKVPPNFFDDFMRASEYRAQLLHAELAEAKARSAQLDAVYESMSWRITAPLRTALTLATEARSRIAGFRAARQTIMHGLRMAVLRGSTWLRRYPALEGAVMALMRQFHYLKTRLLRLRGNQKVTLSFNTFSNEIRSEIPETPFALPLPQGRRKVYLYVDHTVSYPQNTGVQRVTRGLASSLRSLGENVVFVKWSPSLGKCVLINMEERRQLALCNGPAVDKSEAALYPSNRETVVPVRAHVPGENNWLVVPEVTHITPHDHPVTLNLLQWARAAGLRTGFVFYDAIPLKRDEFLELAEKHEEYMRQLLLCDVVWPISRWSARDLLTFWIKNESASTKTMPRVQAVALPGESDLHPRVKKAGEHEKFILCVGSVEPRKNQAMLLKAFSAYKKKHPESEWRLVIVGTLHALVAKDIHRAQRADKAITHLGHISDEELDKLYRSCAFTVFPSMEEGAGLPILESLWYAKPCLCANFGAMAEVAEGGGCYMVDVRDQDEFDRALEELIEDESLRQRLAGEAASRHIATWDEYGAAIRDEIEREGQPARRLGRIYYWVDATLEFTKNTGIQRVARQLARELLRQGFTLIPVKWDRSRSGFGPVSEKDLLHLAKWSGPGAGEWHEWTEPEKGRGNDWFFMPELPLNRTAEERASLLGYVGEAGLRSAAIFFDAIPWKMRDIYPRSFAEAHREYMLELSGYNLVLPISSFSQDDLLDFLGASLARPQGLDAKIKAVILAGEFPQSRRTKTVKPASEEKGPITILTVGTIEPRKNHETLLKAFELASSSSTIPLRLVIAGNGISFEPALTDRIRSFVDSHPDVIWEEDADDKRLRELHAECDFTVYPSVEEGFGLPILESLWYAKPCICANFGAMAEVAEGGGCITVDVRDAEALAEAIVGLANNASKREALAREAMARPFKTWREYSLEVAARLAEATPEVKGADLSLPSKTEVAERSAAMRLRPRPRLSVCISTYNRAEWLAKSLENFSRLYPEPIEGVEVLVCDNASTDNTPDVVKPYLKRGDFAFHRNIRNVGMLGNLRVTAHRARGEYVWILGDDDLLVPGALERVLAALEEHGDTALVYLNYAYTRIEDARTIKDFEGFFSKATPIVPPEKDLAGPIRTICARNENFFTAIYTLVFRRDHALRAYSQDTSGRPFSTMLTCIPTTYYVLHKMMDEPGLWIGEPQVVVNMNVSWLKYAPLWILERLPEVYELAEHYGAKAEEVDRWRRHSLQGVVHYFKEIYTNDPEGNAAFFRPERLVRRFRHLPEFARIEPELRKIYARAHEAGHPAAAKPVEKVFTGGKGPEVLTSTWSA